MAMDDDGERKRKMRERGERGREGRQKHIKIKGRGWGREGDNWREREIEREAQYIMYRSIQLWYTIIIYMCMHVYKYIYMYCILVGPSRLMLKLKSFSKFTDEQSEKQDIRFCDDSHGRSGR